MSEDHDHLVCPSWLSRCADLHPNTKLVFGCFFSAAVVANHSWFVPNLDAMGATLGLTRGQVLHHLSRLTSLAVIEMSRCVQAGSVKIMKVYRLATHHELMDAAEAEPLASPVLYIVNIIPREPQAQEVPVRAHLRLVP